MMRKAIVVIVVISAFLLVNVDADSLMQKRIHLVDHTEAGNFLFRGNEPVEESTKSFAYSELVHYLSATASSHHLQLPKDFLLIDISFLNPKTVSPDRGDLEIEEKYANSTDKVVFVRLTLLGDKIDPKSVEEGERTEKAKKLPEWQGDKLKERVDQVRAILMNRANRPIVIYAHCEQGIDRTGEFIGSYTLRWLSKAWFEVKNANFYIARRNPMHVHQNSLVWYCLYLKESGIRPDLTCLDF